MLSGCKTAPYRAKFLALPVLRLLITGLFLIIMLRYFNCMKSLVSVSGAMAFGELRDGGRRIATSVHPVQPLPPTLLRQQARSRERRLLRQADPVGVPRTENQAFGHQGQLQVPLLRHTRQSGLRTQSDNDFGRYR